MRHDDDLTRLRHIRDAAHEGIGYVSGQDSPSLGSTVHFSIPWSAALRSSVKLLTGSRRSLGNHTRTFPGKTLLACAIGLSMPTSISTLKSFGRPPGRIFQNSCERWKYLFNPCRMPDNVGKIIHSALTCSQRLRGCRVQSCSMTFCNHSAISASRASWRVRSTRSTRCGCSLRRARAGAVCISFPAVDMA